ncbi:MAG: hypothetical protein JRH11_21245 [Deltaproteobacteria bacterium]|nr:hypothetical protein [Deltaproteobacteria bacterium]
MFRTSSAISVIVALTATVFFSACGDDGDDAPALGEEAAEAVAAAPAAAGGGEAPAIEEEPDPCAVLTEAMVRTTFEVPAETAIANPAPLNDVRRMCQYRWDKPNRDELQLEIRQRMQENTEEMARRMRSGEESPARQAQNLINSALDLPRLENAVTLNYGPTFADADAARVGFEQATTRLQEGIRQPVKTKNIDQEVVFQADTEVVEGIGDAARALPRLNQLAVLDGARILYIVVEMDLDRAANIEHCKRLARLILR